MKIGFISLGCSKNRVDSENVMGLLSANQHIMVSEPSEAEAIFVNTCGFITPAKEEAINTILQMSEIKKQTGAKLVVLGCLSQRYHDDLVQLLPEVDRFITLDEYPVMDEILTKELGIIVQGVYGKKPRLLSTQPWMGYLKIAEGCSNRCTYCAIPLIRGNFRSYPMETLLEQARHLSDKGVKEIVLIAQDTTRYGIDLYHKFMLADLCEEIAKLEGIRWIRILYMYPDELSKEMIDRLADIPKVLPYFDLPLQHGDDAMLKAMNRRGDVKSIKETIAYIRQIHPQAIIRTTMIVGFPGETKKHFDNMLSFVKELKFDRLGAFTYSKEEDTPAFSFAKEPRESTKNKRYKELMMIQQEIAQHLNEAWIGKEVEVLVEAMDTITKTAKGRSVHSAPDNIDGVIYVKVKENVKPGSFIKATIDHAHGHDLHAHQS
jgi:ribosomal protein S12 methylthiotransferase